MEFCKYETKSMEIEMRPEAARRRKPCSKIEAKLLSRRRSKLENEEKKSSSLEETPKNSSSESDISPRLFTSKQHVELVNFDSQKMIPAFRKHMGNLLKKSEKYANKTRNGSNYLISDSNGKTHECLVSKSRSQNLFSCSNEDSNHLESIEKLDKGSNLIEICSKKELHHLSMKEPNKSNILKDVDFNKRRSRSAPCTPLFKIKCAKDKYPRDPLIDVKNLAANEIREKIANSRTNAPLYLRLSRSGDVSISSCEKSSNENLIERTSSRDSEIDDELILFPNNSGKLEKPKEESVGVYSATDKPSEEERIDVQEKNTQLNETSELGHDSQILSKNLSTVENTVEDPSNEEIQEEKKCVNDEKLEETIISIAEKPVNKAEGRDVSPKKLPKKREFKWETILEKQHRQLTSSGSINCKKTTAVTGKVDNNEFKSWTEKPVNTLNENSPPASRNCFEADKLAAYSAIKEELPRLFIKRQISDAMKREKKEIEERAKIIRESDHPNVHVCKKPEIASQIVEHCTKRADRTKQENCRSQKSFSKHSPRKNNHSNAFPMNIQESQETQRPPILKRRKTPSPRRVTFRLPGRIINDEKFTEEKIQLKTKIQDRAIESDNFYDLSDKFQKKIERHDNVPHSYGSDRLTENDLQLNYCTQHKSHSFQVAKSSNHKAQKNIMTSSGFRVVGERENSDESEDLEQDWETPTSEDTYRPSKDVQFPKETREAMNILRTAKANVQCNHFDRARKITKNVEGNSHNRQARSDRNQNLPIASSYAVALAKFQERCNEEDEPKFISTTGQNRGSRNANVAVGK